MLSFRYVFTILYICGYNGHISGCPTSCASCYINRELCQRCLAGYWLTNYHYCHPCPGGCAECSDNVHCTKCKANYWGIYCTFKCFGNCDENGCYDVSGYCHQCKSGYYGQNCREDCELCKKQSCSRSQCTTGCVDGYYEYTSDDGISCQQCHQNCAVCERYDYCLECKKGFYKLYYNSDGINRIYCSQCEQNCEECTVRSKCTVCHPGTYGSKCEKTCKLSNCYRCTGSNENIEKCIECEAGYKFDENECVPCVSNGICSEECTAGYWGGYCNKTCHEGCASCNQTNGYCYVCLRNRYGEYCNFTCSEHCADDGTIFRVCSNKTGKCEHGCGNQYSGDKCDISPSAVSSGSSPSTTVKKTDTYTDTHDESNQQQIGLFIGVGAGVGALIITVVVVVIVYVVRRRKKRRKDATHVTDVGNEHPQNDIGEEYIYAQPNKQKKMKHLNKEEISGPQDTFVANDRGIEDDKYEEIAEDETDIDTILLENIDDELKGTIVTEVNIPDSDTYYNMFGLKRSRIHLSKLFEYIKDKSDFEKEFEKLPQGLTRTCTEALKPQNRAKNRYNGIYAYDATRVVLQSRSYINANYIDDNSQCGISYIASLGPTKNTMNNFATFWEMVWQEKSNKIVMLTNLEESKEQYIFLHHCVLYALTCESGTLPITTVPHFMTDEKIAKQYQSFQNITLLPNKENEGRAIMQPANRKGADIPDDDHRVRLTLAEHDYINAVYVNGYKEVNKFIIAQTPLPNTVEDFMSMLYQERCPYIVCLDEENITDKKMKCHQYWPNQGSLAKYGDYTVNCTAEKMFSDFVVRAFTIEWHSEKRQITQYHYTAWPDKTVPHTVASLIEFRDKVEQGESEVQGPIIIHCSAGIGRTGTYIGLDILIREGKKEDSVDVFGCVIALRGQRVSLVQNVEQYIFLHHCVLYALTCESGTLPITTVPHFMTDEKIAKQYQSFQNITLLPNKENEGRAIMQPANRKGADIPDDDHRVRLTLAEHDYINAVYVNGYKEVNKFIIAQTPLPNTVEDFMSMLYQERCPYIVCLDEENITDKAVAQYIPLGNKVLTFGHLQATCTNSDTKEDFVIRDLKISRIGSPPAKELKTRHYQFKGWKSSDIVPKTIPFLNLISDVEKSRKDVNPKQPIAVHCSTGSERSGLFSVMSILLEKMATDKEMSVLNTICQVRSRRRSALQNIEQLRFCYKSVEEMLKMSDTNTYYNISNV